MKRILLLLAFVPVVSFADTYQVNFGWTDPTTYIPSDSPKYEAKWRVNGGTETVIPNLATPGGSFTATATPGQTVEIAGRAVNKTLSSPWTAWVTGTAPYPTTQPANQTSLSITIIRTGP